MGQTEEMVRVQNKTNEPAQTWRLSSCVISPFKFHKQLNILRAFVHFFVAHSHTRKKQCEQKEGAVNGGARRKEKFLWRLACVLLRP